jgi:succinate-semialdehyde dehydrogenase/glutarate-semialdehyde dehydrogenase
MAITETRRAVDLKLYVGGDWVEGSGDGVIEIRSPATGEHIANLPKASADDVRRAAEAAGKAQREWRNVGAWQRAEICHRIGDELERRVDELAQVQTLEQGKPLAESVGDIKEAAELYHLHAEDMLRLYGETLPSADTNKRILTFHRPVGVWGVITPWNFPFLIPTELIAPGLATGNALVVKPPSHTPMTTLKAMEAFEAAGLPRGLVSIVPGDADVGQWIVREPAVDAIGFVGSSATGEKIQAASGLKRTIMECSGNGPVIVCADANVAEAAKAAAFGAYFCAGQVCVATERVLVHRSVHDEFVEASLAEAGNVVLGDPFQESTNLGPLNNEPVAAKMDRHMADAVDKGAEVLAGGRRRADMPTNLYYEYTLVDSVREDMLLNREESFGPVVPVISGGSDEELLEIANRDPLGLQAAVFTSSLRSAFFFMENLETGQVIVNDTTDYWDINMPFGGAGGKNTGWGRIGGKYTLMDMTDLRTGVIDFSKAR